MIAEIAFPLPLPKTFYYRIPQELLSKVARGARVRAPFGTQRSLAGVVLNVLEETSVSFPPRLKEIESILSSAPALTEDLLDLSAWLSRRYAAPLGGCLEAVSPMSLAGPAHPVGSISRSDPPPARMLTQDQELAVEKLKAQLESGKFSVTLLSGVPASGKTEVYLRLVAEVVRQGAQALFLVPEISLTPPFFEEFSSRIELPVVLWHSRLGLKERRLSWLQLSSGEKRVVIGVRSACLLPFRNLKLICMDEEQDESYKQDGQSPHYHAREVLLYRAERAGALVVLGSATPSMESLLKTASGEWGICHLSDRISNLKEAPQVRVVDCRQARRPDGPLGFRSISEELQREIQDRLARKEQVILLVNRRGFSHRAFCPSCGWTARCLACGIAMVFHKENSHAVFRCHHCSHTMPPPASCGQCSNMLLRFKGTGTQRLAEELQGLFPQARLLRMDRDTVSRERKRPEKIYDQFRQLKADILLGTKLVSKGFHFPQVTLVGVLDVDGMLELPDFRAAEKTAQMLYQVAGRAGRGDVRGLVLIQTRHPQHYVIQSVLSGDYARFSSKELELRKELLYPPFTTIVCLLLSGIREKDVDQAAEAVAGELRHSLASHSDVLGPAPGVYKKLRGRFRYQILVKVRDSSRLEEVIQKAQALKTPSSVRLNIHVDPYDLL